jgi:hypothetical protein
MAVVCAHSYRVVQEIQAGQPHKAEVPWTALSFILAIGSKPLELTTNDRLLNVLPKKRNPENHVASYCQRQTYAFDLRSDRPIA